LSEEIEFTLVNVGPAGNARLKTKKIQIRRNSMKKELCQEPQQRKSSLLIVAALAGILLCSISAQAQADSQPTGFEFYFNGPARGLRVWTRNKEMWTETYASGQTDTFRVKAAPFHHNGMTGTLVQKVSDRNFYVFIPNLRSKKMEVWTYQGKGPWRFLAKMNDVRPGEYTF
jgi:hypothetical protein